MAVGSLQTILVCSPSAFGQAPCPAGHAVTTMQAYVLDPSQQAVFEAPFDYVFAAGVWSFAFCFVVGLFLISRSAGTVIDMFRR